MRQSTSLRMRARQMAGSWSLSSQNLLRRFAPCTFEHQRVPSTKSSSAVTARTRKPPAQSHANQFLDTGRHPRTRDQEETLRVLMRKTKFSGHSNVDTDIADYDDHYLESLFAGRTKSGIIHLGPDEMASKHKIRVNLKIGTKNTRIGVPRELEGG